MRALGVDLAWGEGSEAKVANETGVVALESNGRICDAGWTRGLTETVSWIEEHADEPAVVFVDAPLVVNNRTGQRACERHVGQRYGRWKVSANSTNLGSSRLAGVTLRRALEGLGWTYDDGCRGPTTAGRAVSECYPYTTLVGASELGYDVQRPSYKRKPRNISSAEWKAVRARSCDDLIRRIAGLSDADPPLCVASHPTTQQLVDENSPLDNPSYKHREDLIDALLCAWTARLWLRHGLARCQVLGEPDKTYATIPTIIAPCRSDQRPTRHETVSAE
jgi:predicted RNase H-like nuclease